MDPVWVLFWSVVALLVGFLASTITIGTAAPRGDVARDYARDSVFGIAVLAAMFGVGLWFAALLGNTSVPHAAFSLALAAGLAWSASQYLPVRVRIRIGETWSERLERWGFPSSHQMTMAAFREDLRGRLSLVSTPHPHKYSQWRK